MSANRLSVAAEAQRSVDAAVRAGDLDPDLHAAPIAAMLKVADQMDAPGYPVVQDRWDNVSASLFLRYCQALGLVPDLAAQTQPRPKRRQLGDLRAQVHILHPTP
jgi:hypothetical protein